MGDRSLARGSLEVRGSPAAGRLPPELVSARGLEVKVPRASRLPAGSNLQLLVGNRRLALKATFEVLQGRDM